MDTDTWQHDVRAWLQRRRVGVSDLADDAVLFFQRAFSHTRCPSHAWFGIHSQTASLVVGGIFLAALVRSGNDKWIWLLVDENPPNIDGLEYRPVKSTKHSDASLTWAHSSSPTSIRDVVASPSIWDSYATASLKVLSSSTASADRDTVQQNRNKRRLSEIWPVFQSPENCIFPDDVIGAVSLREGSVRKVCVNAYERNPVARKVCVDHFGPSCVVCGFNFRHVYGDFADGFIHVHHLRPISRIAADYEVDPIEDLRPICPNCHAVIHFRDPPYTIEEIKEMMGAIPVGGSNGA